MWFAIVTYNKRHKQHSAQEANQKRKIECCYLIILSHFRRKQ